MTAIRTILALAATRSTLKVALDIVGDPQLGERYAVCGRLGAGGGGDVLAAWDRRLGRTVAVKVARSRDVVGATRSGEARLRVEAAAMAQVRSPHVVPIYDVVEREGRVHLVMERVHGPDLRRWLQTPRARPQIVRRFVEAARGLQAIHAAGLVHGDFKPANVLVPAQGPARVTDFGLSFALDRPPSGDALQTGRAGPGVGGTPRYMAPEQWDGEPPCVASDLFSYCVALYEALLGRHPFASLGPDAGPAHEPRGLPRAWAALLLRGLSRDPSARPGLESVVEVLGSGPRLRRPWMAVAGLGLALPLVAAGPLSPSVSPPTTMQVSARSGLELDTAEHDRRHRAERERKIRGDHAQAEPQLEALFDEAVAAGNHVLARTIAIDLLETQASRLHRYDEAERWYRHAHAQLQRTPASFGALVQIEQYGAIAAVQQGDAQLAHERLAAGWAAVGSQGSPRHRARLHNGAAFVARHLGQWEQALGHLRHEQQLLVDVLPPDDPHRAGMDSSLGGALMALGRHAEARDRFEAALAGHERAAIPNATELARTLVNVGAAHAELGDYGPATAAFERGLDALQALHGPQSSQLLIVLENLGELHRRQGDLEAARGSLERARRIAMDSRPGDAVTAQVSLHLADVVFEVGEPALASSLLAEALPIAAAYDPVLVEVIRWRQGRARWTLDDDRPAARAAVRAAVAELAVRHGGVDKNLDELEEAKQWLQSH